MRTQGAAVAGPTSPSTSCRASAQSEIDSPAGRETSTPARARGNRRRSHIDGQDSAAGPKPRPGQRGRVPQPSLIAKPSCTAGDCIATIAQIPKGMPTRKQQGLRQGVITRIAATQPQVVDSRRWSLRLP